MTVGYFDATALVAMLSPGTGGSIGFEYWQAVDVGCSSITVEIEVPALAGREINRVAWIFAVNSLTLADFTEEMRSAAIDLAWLGAPPLVSMHVACALALGIDQFVTADPSAASWAELRNLEVLLLK